MMNEDVQEIFFKKLVVGVSDRKVNKQKKGIAIIQQTALRQIPLEYLQDYAHID